MNKYKEYTGFRKDNEAFLSILKKNNSLIYDNFLDAFKILGHIEVTNDHGEVDEDLEVIFDSVFPYVFESMEIVKAFYQNVFKCNYDDFKKYEQVIIYYLFVEDLKLSLEEENKYHKYISKVDEILKELDDIINNKKEVEGVVDDMNFKVASIGIKDIPATMTEIVGMICDELNL